MEEIQAKVKLSAEGDDKVAAAFNKVGNSANKLQKETNNLGMTFGKLAGWFGLAFGASQVIKFFNDAGNEAMKDAEATKLLKLKLDAIGISYKDTSKDIDEFISKMYSLGRADTETTQSLTKFVGITKDINKSMQLTKMASDLAASGVNDFNSNVDNLQKVLLNRGVFAMREFGIAIKDNMTIGEQLDAIQKKITRTTEEWAETTEGKQARMKETWAELKEQMGGVALFFKNTWAEMFLAVFGGAEKKIGDFGKNLVKNFAMPVWRVMDTLKDTFTGKFKEIFDVEGREKQLNEKFDKLWNSVVGTDIEGKKDNSLDYLNNLTDGLNNLGNEADKTAEKMRDTFKDLSKSIIKEFTDQRNEIKKLKDELKSLDETHEEALKDMARNSQENLDKIDKDIAEEKATMNKGWRTRIEDLEKQKAKEQGIISRISGKVSNLPSELSKDELTLLEEDYQKEKLTKQKDILEREKFLTERAVDISKPGFFNSYIKENQSFLGQVGAGGIANSFVFNFNGDVNDKDALIRTITDILNREATLRGVSASK